MTVCGRRIWILGTLSVLASGCTPARPSVPVPQSAPRRGPPNAKLTLQEIGDYECPFCAEVQPAVEQLMTTFGAELALVWRHYPLPSHPSALLAAESAVEVKAQLGDEGFWRYHATLFQNQAALTAPDLERYAASVGADVPRFSRALKERTHRAEVEADQRSIDQLKIERLMTPAFLLPGDHLVGAYPYDALAQWVEDRL
jgi:protein-disulfide isomerase